MGKLGLVANVAISQTKALLHSHPLVFRVLWLNIFKFEQIWRIFLGNRQHRFVQQNKWNIQFVIKCADITDSPSSFVIFILIWAALSQIWINNMHPQWSDWNSKPFILENKNHLISKFDILPVWVCCHRPSAVLCKQDLWSNGRENQRVRQVLRK